MKTAIYTGSFDPPTMGHMDIIAQSARVFEKIAILIATNPEKKYLFTEEERIKFWEEIVVDHFYGPNNFSVEALPKDRYAVEFILDAYQDPVLIRGLRNIKDLEEEKVIQKVNKSINPTQQTVYFISGQGYEHVSSTLVKGLLGIKGWEDIVYNLVPVQVLHVLKEKFK